MQEIRAAVDAFWADLKKGCNNIISCDQLQEQIEKKSPLYILDIRKPEDYAEDHIDGAINIPWGEVGDYLDDLPKDEKIIVVCYTGQTAGQTVALLKLLGFDCCSLKGGMSCDKAHLPLAASCSS
ncbi:MULTISPECIES: rhodanese-like domain-containing protein [Dethiosulfovibrio]|jgi:rhodanese-related sulfurtransferase|uniref:Rhodanese-like domain-containing protein n=2 Tax=Dethiosulfovibrio TaxID=47054 RepID=A0ABS9ETA2_9BACT|nr:MULTISPECIES: rhodanese-like domain-containing protein [Dethiosulfovibrio]MCF4114767.1 rhodanese-like domain-containing protein [Dethiosulfovibrio russensis]MCF4143028.1 rhodanese-like domain-containing protein [Dethiosulfovibrio marinus]MCF4145272.1 rhodanese-like domain-containing protein [Dethiosulfovibrio acidaminovorans]MEA3284720.1 rhodanese-like domain-containing protein [Synergistota bacterium]